MTDNEMRMAIAEKCPIIFRVAKESGDIIWMRDGHEQDCDPINDLNAMHEAEKTMTGNQFVEYIRKLKYVCNPGCNLTNEHNQFSHVTATARQRAEAFIKTICPEKWKGNE